MKRIKRKWLKHKHRDRLKERMNKSREENSVNITDPTSTASPGTGFWLANVHSHRLQYPARGLKERNEFESVFPSVLVQYNKIKQSGWLHNLDYEHTQQWNHKSKAFTIITIMWMSMWNKEMADKMLLIQAGKHTIYTFKFTHFKFSGFFFFFFSNWRLPKPEMAISQLLGVLVATVLKVSH